VKERTTPNALSPDQLGRFLAAMKADSLYSRNYALTVMLAFTGLRFCHASALKWEDIDFELGVIRIARRQVLGQVGPVSRKKRAPRELPLPSALAEILKEHRRWLVEKQNPGLDKSLKDHQTLLISSVRPPIKVACNRENHTPCSCPAAVTST